jgi:hypothetical protein
VHKPERGPLITLFGIVVIVAYCAVLVACVAYLLLAFVPTILPHKAACVGIAYDCQTLSPTTSRGSLISCKAWASCCFLGRSACSRRSRAVLLYLNADRGYTKYLSNFLLSPFVSLTSQRAGRPLPDQVSLGFLGLRNFTAARPRPPLAGARFFFPMSVPKSTPSMEAFSSISALKAARSADSFSSIAALSFSRSAISALSDIF